VAGALFKNPDFVCFWLGQGASALGDAFAFVAMPLLVLDLTGSVAHMGNVTALACAAHITMSLVAGVIVDRVDRRVLMIATDLLRMLLFAALPIAFFARGAGVWIVYAVAGLGAALGNLFLVAHTAATKSIVRPDELARANSRIQATQALAFAVGPMAAGVVCARFGAAWAIAVDAVSFGVSAASLATVRFGRAQGASMGAAAPAGGVRDLATGLRFLSAQPVLRGTIALQVFVGFLACAGMNAAVVDLFVFRLRHDLGASDRAVGITLGGAALGALAGALLSPRVRRRFHSGACLLSGTSMQAIGLGVAGLVEGPYAVLLGAMLWAMGLTVRAVVNISLRQELTPDALLGRVMAAATTVVFGAATVGAVVVTRAAAALGAGPTLAVTGATLGLVVLVATTRPIARAA
jgi:MFS family permease